MTGSYWIESYNEGTRAAATEVLSRYKDTEKRGQDGNQNSDPARYLMDAHRDDSQIAAVDAAGRDNKGVKRGRLDADSVSLLKRSCLTLVAN